MSELDLTTEEKILKAAETIFLRDGYDGSRMQDIANEAGINKALLHYYFRSKDKLFEHVFDKKIGIFFPKADGVFDLDIDFADKIGLIIEGYINLLRENPYLPLFVLNTVNNPEKSDFIKKLPVGLMQKIALNYFVELQKGNVRSINPMQFVMSIMGMCAFPFLARPILLNAFGADKEAFDVLMKQRIEELKLYVKLILTP
ncbi:AcrR family transcriptional regulator [Runella defluvii]|uniref:AcrR family transcriptional regulator n=1 Tax=Runella defluvii TaxID=370973 RepID=A0A7W5ZQH4_9BACT|nr:TetR/AcrR family transcriptional regulator [Runella defluvii]MBB3841790.1 AcrR family transcriptional regulator [Runella defluvii]